jgi:hypothetical protein
MLNITLIRPVVLYGSESWTLTKADEEKLRTLKEEYNDELYGLYKDLDIVRVIKVASIRWPGHLIRMEENSPCEKITSQPEGSWKKGRPKLRWLDSVLKDVKLLKIETWKKACDRNIWGKIIKEAKVHKGL